MGAIALVATAIGGTAAVQLSKKFPKVDRGYFAALAALVIASALASIARWGIPSLPGIDTINRVATVTGIGMWMMIIVHLAVTTNRKIDTAIVDLAKQIGVSASGLEAKIGQRAAKDSVASMLDASRKEMQSVIDSNRVELIQALLADAQRAMALHGELQDKVDVLRRGQDAIRRSLRPETDVEAIKNALAGKKLP